MSNSLILQDRISIPNLCLELQIYRNSSGLSHLHLQTQDQHRACAIAFRTAVDNDTGVAHALEHTALCGSQRYPVRDPFFMMLRRSMQTYMNAMTGSDCTWYPFATQNEQDFYNLFNVYVDAVFHPKLHELDIAQEAYRISPDGTDQWKHNGVVYNEMKGASCTFDSILYQALCAHLLPGTTYAQNTGGDPFAISQLNAQHIRSFHQEKYHCANACISTYGDLDIAEIHKILEQCPISIRERDPAPPLLEPNNKTSSHTIPIPIDDGESIEESGHCINAFLWGDAADPIDALIGDICEALLFGHAAAPMRLALESSGLCQSVEGSGYWDYCRNGIFSIEAHGCDPNNYDAIQQLIDKEIRKICDNGFDESEISIAINHVEMHERYIGGEQEPFGMQLCEQLIDAWNYDINPALMIDSDQCFRDIKSRYQQNKQYFNNILCERFSQSIQRVNMNTEATNTYHQALADHEAHIINSLSTKEKADFASQEHALIQRQQQTDDPDILPMISVSDIPVDYQLEPYQASYMPCLSNGLSMLHLTSPIQLRHSKDFHNILMLSQLLGELGHQTYNYQQSAKQLHRQFGHISSAVDTWMHHGTLYASLCTNAWGLSNDCKDMQTFLLDYIKHMRFDEHTRIHELCEQSLHAHKEQFVAHGTKYAALAAQAACSPIAHVRNMQAGMPHYKYLLNKKNDIPRYSKELLALHQSIDWSSSSLHLAQQNKPSFLHPYCKNPMPRQVARAQPGPACKWLAYVINANVHYCALALPAPPFNHNCAAALAVVGHLLTNTYLHTKIREQQGAYGASAFYNPNLESFVMTSYRDPGMENTITTMQHAFEFLETHTFTQNEIDEAKISAIAEFDKPSSPFGNVKRRIQMERHCLSEDDWQDYRKRLLQVSSADIHQVRELFNGTDAYCCVLGPEESIKQSNRAWQLEQPLTWS